MTWSDEKYARFDEWDPERKAQALAYRARKRAEKDDRQERIPLSLEQAENVRNVLHDPIVQAHRDDVYTEAIERAECLWEVEVVGFLRAYANKGDKANRRLQRAQAHIGAMRQATRDALYRYFDKTSAEWELEEDDIDEKYLGRLIRRIMSGREPASTLEDYVLELVEQKPA